MRAYAVAVAMAIGGSVISAGERLALAAEQDVSITVLPVRYISVNGDASKFRAHHWMNDGYAGGVKAFSAKYLLPDGTWLSTEAHAIPNDNDYGAALSIKKDTVGFVDLDFSEFRKWYPNSAGVHRRFTDDFQSFDTDKELALDIGTFAIDTELTLEGWPELGFEYERTYKDGAKSRLTWAAVKEVSETRYLTPSWQDVDEVVDSFALKASQQMAGFALKGEQRWELVRTETLREEQLRSDASGADRKIRRQDQAPESTLMTTLLEGERWFLNEKALVSSAYRFAHMNNREFESIVESDENGTPTNFGAPKQIRDARADNDYDTHTWVGSFMASPSSEWTFGTKLKSEVIKRESNSTYPADNEAGGPDGLINQIDASLNNVKAVRWGEGFSARFTGVPRTALYTELELEQSRVLLREDRQSLDGPDAGNGSSAGEVFSRETVTDVRRGAGTLGAQIAPWPILNLTAHVRRRINDTDYDDQRESTAAATALSAFIESQNVHTNEFVTRATLRPSRWLRSSLRYQFRHDDYTTWFEAQAAVKTGMRSHIYTADLTLQPLQELVTTASFSRQTASVTTPARLNATLPIPTFNADVNTWLLSADYTPTPRVTLTGGLQYSQANNFNDFANTGFPLGAEFQRVDVTTGVRWSLTDQTSVGAEYGFYKYNPNENVEVGGYEVHALSLEVSYKF